MEKIVEAKLKKTFLTILGLLVLGTAMNAETRFTLRFFDKEIYYPGRPVKMLATVKNTGDTPYWFSMPNNPVFNLKFRIMTLGSSGIYLPNSDKFNENRYNNQPVFFRDISLKPGEEFSFTFDLQDFADISEPGVYSVEAEFFPTLLPEFQAGTHQSLLKEVSTSAEHGEAHQASLEEAGEPSQRSNVLTLSVRSPLPETRQPVYEQHMDEASGEILRRENLSPDAVVAGTLEARQDAKKEKFFLYLNLEELYKRSPLYRRSFLQSSFEDRERMLADYRESLWQKESPISKVPASFEILHTAYQDKEGLVKTRMRFDGGDFYEIKEYTYALRKKAGYWEIYDYQVRNLGTEAKKSNKPKAAPATAAHGTAGGHDSGHDAPAAAAHTPAAPAHGAGH